MTTVPDEYIREKIQPMEKLRKRIVERFGNCKTNRGLGSSKTEPAPLCNSSCDNTNPQQQQQQIVINPKVYTRIVDVVNKISLVIYAIVIAIVCLTILIKYLSEMRARAPRYNDVDKSSFFLRGENFFSPSTTTSTAC